MMGYKVFTFSAVALQNEIEELNKFLRSNKIVEVDKHLITQRGGVYWTFCVTYLFDNNVYSSYSSMQQRQEKIDYKNVLDDVGFELFSRLRSIRREIAREEAIPAYAVFTDAELSEIAKLKEITEQNMRTIKGIGAKKVDKYGSVFCRVLSETDVDVVECT